MRLKIEEIPDHVGAELGPTEWRIIDQERINAFADATGDHQWIHVDPARASTGPFGATLAHGYLTLSLGPALLAELLEIVDAGSAINYGLDRVRFPAPVLAGSKLRARVAIAEAEHHDWGVQTKFRFTIECENVDKPVCVADSLIQYRF